MKPEFRTYQAPTAQQVQDEAFRVFDSCGTLLVARRLRVTLTVATSPLKIAHGLHAVPEDVLLGAPSAVTRVWMPTQPDAKFIFLSCDADCTLTVWLL